MDQDAKIRQLRRQDMAHRKKLGREDQETLLPCPACDGSGSTTVAQGTGYRMKACPWCDGSGTTTHRLIAAYRRFLKEGETALK